ncbi:SET domain-containing protein [Obba rivulosa]|uniref:SET domain-containing protein n=1 Tax=Obba rivulosa TaxID=1052685 RepID=A0A8E2DEI6_9APHY|nr:SET domain-containing protein [Obba rivulosa]
MCRPKGSDQQVKGLSSGLSAIEASSGLVLTEKDPSAPSPSANPERRRLTSIPLTYFDASKNDPDGSTQCILLPGMKEAIYAQFGFPLRIPRLPSPAHCLKHVDGAGLGMFATRAIGAGDLICSERPLFLGPGAWVYAGARVPVGDAMSQLFQEWDEFMKIAVDRMEPEKQDAYRALANSHLHDGSPALIGILRTNGFSVSGELRKVFPSLPKDELSLFTAIGEVLSRVNHSCRPNANILMDMPSFSLQLVALRPIAAGEEITVSYTNVMGTHAERQRKLAPYGFTCTCHTCVNPALSDDRRRQLKSLQHFLTREYFDGWLNPRSSLPDDHWPKKLQEVRQLVQEEGLYETAIWSDYLARLRDVFAALGDQEKVFRCCRTILDIYSATDAYVVPEARQSAAAMYAAPSDFGFWGKKATSRPESAEKEADV